MSLSAKQKSHRKGLLAELYAAAFLLLKGYGFLKWRYKTKVGEIDLIMVKDKTIIALEVKAHKTQSSSLEAVTPHAQKRITRAIQMFLQENAHYQNYDVRFDVIAVYGGCLIRHLDNAWMTPS